MNTSDLSPHRRIDRRRIRKPGPSAFFMARLALGTEVWDEVLAPVGIRLDPWQRWVLTTKAKRILICCSRQAGKSTAGALLALKTAITRPRQLIILISPSLRQSSELFRKVVSFLELLPLKPRETELNRLSVKFENKSRIVSLPCSEQTIRGFSGVNLIIEDEASRVDDEVHNCLRPMIATSGGRYIMMSTPAGKRGHFWAAWESDEWEKVRITAFECSRIPRDFLEDERRSLGESWFAQEYNCDFIDAEGQVFRSEDLQAMLLPPSSNMPPSDDAPATAPYLEVV